MQPLELTPRNSTGERPPPMVSVVSPFYNRKECLPALIGTLRDQSFTDFELVIADDGSTDDLAGAVAELKAGFPVRYIRLAPNRGAAAARNAGIDAAAGRYIALLDSDDGWHPEKLRLQLRQFQGAANAGMLVSLTRQEVKARFTYIAPACLMAPEDDVGSYLFLRGGVIQSSMMMLCRSLAVQVRFDESSRGHDDWSFALRLQAAGARFSMLEQPLTIYDDTSGRARRSPAYSSARLGWLEAHRTELGEKAYWAAAASVASHLRRTSEVSPFGIIRAAYRQKAIGAGRAAYYAAAWVYPGVRSMMRGVHQVWNSRPSGWIA